MLLKGRNGQHAWLPQKIQSIRAGKQVSFYPAIRRLVTFGRAVSMEWRDWKPDCSGLRTEWEIARVDTSLQKHGHLAGGR